MLKGLAMGDGMGPAHRKKWKRRNDAKIRNEVRTAREFDLIATGSNLMTAWKKDIAVYCFGAGVLVAS